MDVELRGRVLRVTRDDDTIEEVTIPLPSVGWGGGAAVVSPERRWVAVVWDSGQSDAGVEVFALHPQLARAGGIPRVYGSGAIVAFSPDARALAMLSAVTPYLDADPDEEEREVEWAELRVLALPAGAVSVCSIVTTLPPIPEQGSTFCYPAHLRFVASDRIEVAGPSGTRIEVAVPLPASVEVDPPDLGT